ncbi:MAG: hypothetical protein H7336_15345 [Bacteriovorax sp.]|nr:hypothetical protein [Bacteriovorax sp.]
MIKLKVIGLLFFSLNAFSQTQTQERVPIKLTETNGFGMKKETDLLPGNDSFGFFYKELTSETSHCRFKTKVTCDYGLGSTKVIKHKEVRLEFNDGSITHSTDDQGILDLVYKCQPSLIKKSMTIKIGGYQKIMEVPKFPKNLVLSSDDCKLVK